MEQISGPELDRLVELYDRLHNADFSEASEKAADEAYSEYIGEVTRLHEAKCSNLSIEHFKRLVAKECKKMIWAGEKKSSHKKKGI